jgi:hypothetical protein
VKIDRHGPDHQVLNSGGAKTTKKFFIKHAVWEFPLSSDDSVMFSWRALQMGARITSHSSFSRASQSVTGWEQVKWWQT